VRRELVRLQACAERVQRMACGDLRLTPPVREPRCSIEHRRSQSALVRALGLQHSEPWDVDRLERQLRLKTFGTCRIELAGSPQLLIAFEAGAIALKTQWTLRDVEGRRMASPRPRRRLQGIPARSTQDLRAFAFELSAWEANPFFPNALFYRRPNVSTFSFRHARSLAWGCDRGGHNDAVGCWELTL